MDCFQIVFESVSLLGNGKKKQQTKTSTKAS